MQNATHSAAFQVAQQFTGQYLPPQQPTKRRSDPAQLVSELGGCAFPPLELVTKPNLKTEEAAYYLNRRPQTLRAWAMRDGTGPIRPLRIGGLLAWPTSQVKVLAGIL